MKMTDRRKDLRPRERLQSKDSEALSDYREKTSSRTQTLGLL